MEARNVPPGEEEKPAKQASIVRSACDLLSLQTDNNLQFSDCTCAVRVCVYVCVCVCVCVSLCIVVCVRSHFIIPFSMQFHGIV